MEIKFEQTLEGKMVCDGELHDTLEKLFDEQPESLKSALVNYGRRTIDYISRFTFWAQCIAGKEPTLQYRIIQQLVDVYAIDALAQTVSEELKPRLVPDV